MGSRAIFILIMPMLLTGCWPFDSGSSSNSPITYSAEFIEPTAPTLYACDGEVTLDKVLSSCINNSGQIVDNSKCANIPTPQVIFHSPQGEQVDPLVNEDMEIIGDRTFTCEEGKNRANSQVLVSCTDERYKLKGESNQRDSFCKHFPLKLELSSDLTCIEFSDQKYQCTGRGLNSVLKPFIDPHWPPEEANYLRDIPYFKGSSNLKIGMDYLTSAIKNNKIMTRDFPIGIGNGNNGIDALVVGPVPLTAGVSFYCYIDLNNKLFCKKNVTPYLFEEKFVGEKIVDLSTFSSYYCIKTEIGNVKCEYSNSIVEYPEFFNYKKIYNSYDSCVISPEDKVFCREFNGINPQEIEEFERATDLAIGNDAFCSLIDSKVYCKKYNYYQDGMQEFFREKEMFRGAKNIFTTRVNGYWNIYPEWTFCAIMDNNDVKCTGTNALGQLGTRDLLPKIDDPITLWEF